MIISGIEFPPVADRVPEGDCCVDGDGWGQMASVIHTKMGDREAFLMNQYMVKHLGEVSSRALPWTFEAGRHAVLRIDGRVMMSEHPVELFESVPAVREARGRVLVAGLGLGAILPPMLAKPEVESVTVLESSEAVLRLVAPYYFDPKLEILKADARTWEPPDCFDVIWLDIWFDSTEEHLPDILRMMRRLRRYLAPSGWIGAWPLPEIKILRMQRHPEARRMRLVQRYGGGKMLGNVLLKRKMEELNERAQVELALEEIYKDWEEPACG